MKHWTKKKKVVDLTLIKTKAKIHSILRGRLQIGQNLTDDSVGLLPYTPIKSNKRYICLDYGRPWSTTLQKKKKKKHKEKKSNYTTACDWNENAIFFLELFLGKDLKILTYNVLVQVPVSKLTLGHPLCVMLGQEKKWNGISNQCMTVHHTNTHSLDHNFSLSVYHMHLCLAHHFRHTC